MKFLFAIVCSFLYSHPNDEIPAANKKVVDYVKTSIGKKVGRGECWDLANEALNFANAKWKPPFGFGKEINYKTEIIFPGDIIQLNNVMMESKNGNSITRWKMTQHTAILFEVKDKSKIIIAEQNVDGIRKVQINEWNLDDVKSGKLQFFRPQSN